MDGRRIRFWYLVYASDGLLHIVEKCKCKSDTCTYSSVSGGFGVLAKQWKVFTMRGRTMLDFSSTSACADKLQPLSIPPKTLCCAPRPLTHVCQAKYTDSIVWLALRVKLCLKHGLSVFPSLSVPGVFPVCQAKALDVPEEQHRRLEGYVRDLQTVCKEFRRPNSCHTPGDVASKVDAVIAAFTMNANSSLKPRQQQQQGSLGPGSNVTQNHYLPGVVSGGYQLGGNGASAVAGCLAAGAAVERQHGGQQMGQGMGVVVQGNGSGHEQQQFLQQQGHLHQQAYLLQQQQSQGGQHHSQQHQQQQQQDVVYGHQHHQQQQQQQFDLAYAHEHHYNHQQHHQYQQQLQRQHSWDMSDWITRITSIQQPATWALLPLLQYVGSLLKVGVPELLAEHAPPAAASLRQGCRQLLQQFVELLGGLQPLLMQLQQAGGEAGGAGAVAGVQGLVQEKLLVLGQVLGQVVGVMLHQVGWCEAHVVPVLMQHRDAWLEDAKGVVLGLMQGQREGQEDLQVIREASLVL